MIYSYTRGHQIYYNGTEWCYVDNDDIGDYDRPCKKCGRMPTKEGYDACIGKIDGVTSACCGHGVKKKFVKEI